MPKDSDTPEDQVNPRSTVYYSAVAVIIELRLPKGGADWGDTWCIQARLPCVPVVGDTIKSFEPWMTVIGREFWIVKAGAAGVGHVVLECELEDWDYSMDEDGADVLRENGWSRHESGMAFIQGLSE